METTSSKIAVIGAGVMGVCAAYVLRARYPYAAITIYDAQGFPPARAASMIAGGMLAPYSEIEYLSPEFMPVALMSLDFWENLPREHTGFMRVGTLLLAHKEDAHMLERFRVKIASLNNWRSLDAEQVAQLEPSLEKRFQQGIFIPEEAHILPPLALGALLLSADPFSIYEAYDEKTHAKDYDWVIDCRGYALAAEDPKLRGVKGEVVVVRNQDFKLSRPVRLMHPRYSIYIIPRPNHEFLIGATLIESADNVRTVKSVMELLSAAYSLHPSFAEAEILNIHSGIRPAYPDNLPRIKIEGNVIRCNGLFRHGYLLAPAMAQCAVDYIAGQKNEFTHLFMKENHGHHHQRSEENIKRRA